MAILLRTGVGKEMNQDHQAFIGWAHGDIHTDGLPVGITLSKVTTIPEAVQVAAQAVVNVFRPFADTRLNSTNNRRALSPSGPYRGGDSLGPGLYTI
jgi:hypothetical protein